MEVLSMIGYIQKCINPQCGHEHPAVAFNYVCTRCKGLLLVERDEELITFKLGKGISIRRNLDALRYGADRKLYPNGSGVWRWLDFILPGFPVNASMDFPLSLREGNGDLFTVPQDLCKSIGLKRLLIKTEGQNPSGSFKDMGMPVAISEALRLQHFYPNLNITSVACASTGDTSASAAIYTGYVKNKLKCLVFVPYGGISPAQLAQAMQYGATVIAIDHPDGFDACMKLVAQYCDAHPEFVLVNSKNAFRVAGQETIGLNIIHDLDWQVPDWIAIPVGNGGNLSALMIGLLRAKKFGIIDKLPGIIAAQTAASDTLVRWQNSGFNDYEPHARQETIASAMNINDPVSFPRIKKFYKEFNIRFYSVPEQNIKDTWMRFTQRGAPVCPQFGTTMDAVIQARNDNLIKENDLVVPIATASDLKFSEPAIGYNMENQGIYSNQFVKVDGTIEAINQALAQ